MSEDEKDAARHNYLDMLWERWSVTRNKRTLAAYVEFGGDIDDELRPLIAAAMRGENLRSERMTDKTTKPFDDWGYVEIRDRLHDLMRDGEDRAAAVRQIATERKKDVSTINRTLRLGKERLGDLWFGPL